MIGIVFLFSFFETLFLRLFITVLVVRRSHIRHRMYMDYERMNLPFVTGGAMITPNIYEIEVPVNITSSAHFVVILR